jgi:hypothetical protein
MNSQAYVAKMSMYMMKIIHRAWAAAFLRY